MSYSRDYDIIKNLIDEIVGIDTQQGSNLKMAIKNYFESKPIKVKLRDNSIIETNYEINYKKTVSKDPEMEAALKRYNEKIKKDIKLMKKRGKYYGTK